jgi:hypothetical protein
MSNERIRKIINKHKVITNDISVQAMSCMQYFCIAGSSYANELLNYNIYVIDKVLSEYFFMVLYSCKKCGELNYLTPHAFWNITGFGAKCERCETTNTITLENGELKKQE